MLWWEKKVKIFLIKLIQFKMEKLNEYCLDQIFEFLTPVEWIILPKGNINYYLQ